MSTITPTKMDLVQPLTRFVQDLGGDGKWHTIGGFLDTEAAMNAASMMLNGAKRNREGYWTTPMGRKYRIVTDDGRMVVF